MQLTEHAVSAHPLLKAIGAEGADLSNAALAQATGRNAKNMPRDLDRLVEAGWVTREPGSPPALTDAGRAIVVAVDRANGDGEGEEPGAVDLPLHLIDENPDNPRTTPDEEADAELTASIGARGVLQAIRVRPSAAPGRFVVIAGSRRRRCSIAAGKLTIPAVVAVATDAEAFEQATIENVQRDDMNPMDVARAFKRLIDERMKADPKMKLKAAKEEVSRVVGKSVRLIELRLQLLEELPPIKQAEVQAGKISAKEATEWLRKQPKPLDLPAADWLLALEIYDAVQKAPIGEGYSTQRQTECHADARFANEGPLKSLADYPANLLSVVSHVLDDAGDLTGRFQVGISYYAKDRLELKFGPLATASQRAHAMDGLRQELGHHRLAPGYVTAWLNGPFECPAGVLKEIEADRATRRRQRAEQEADRKAEGERLKAEHDSQAKAERALFDAVIALDAEASALDGETFRERFRAAWATAGVAGPWRLAPGEDQRDPTQLVDAADRPNADRGAALEARRRLMAMALNFAAGLALTSGPVFRTPWNPDAPAAAPPALDEDVISRDDFLDLVADYLLEDNPELDALDAVQARRTAVEQATAGLNALLASEGIVYGDPAWDWEEQGALSLSQGIRVDGLGQPHRDEDDDEPDDEGEGGEGEGGQAEAAPAAPQGDAAETPEFLLRLAGCRPAAQAEAQAHG